MRYRLGQPCDVGPLTGFHVGGPGVILGLWPWNYCICKANILSCLCDLVPKFFQSVQPWSWVQSNWCLPSYFILWCVFLFCFVPHPLFINPLILGDNLFIIWAARAGWVMYLMWTLECHRKNASKWALKSGTNSSTFLFTCFNNRPISMLLVGRGTHLHLWLVVSWEKEFSETYMVGWGIVESFIDVESNPWVYKVPFLTQCLLWKRGLRHCLAKGTKHLHCLPH